MGNNKIKASELVLTEQGQIYHLHLRPEELADDVILVGDPARVAEVSKYFEEITHRSQHREIIAHTGTYRGKRFTVLSTGMGPDNIDIVMNELDALKNIDFSTREIKEEKTSMNIVRIGTSGALQEDIPVDSFVVSRYGVGMDGVLHFYQNDSVRLHDVEEAFIAHTQWNKNVARPYVVASSEVLYNKLSSSRTIEGMTGTAVGFYGPQGRVLRLPLALPQMNELLETFEYQGKRMTNYEMETSAIYGLAKLLGHEACSINCILANRPLGQFSTDARATIDSMIKYTLDALVEE